MVSQQQNERLQRAKGLKRMACVLGCAQVLVTSQEQCGYGIAFQHLCSITPRTCKQQQACLQLPAAACHALPA